MTFDKLLKGESVVFLRGWNYSEGIGAVSMVEPSEIQSLPEDISRDVRCNGFFHNFQGKVTSAVFVLNGKLIFQIDRQRWDWKDDKVRVKHKQRRWITLKNIVVVHAARNKVLKLVYTSPLEKLVKMNYMAFDDLDEEQMDWWLWLSRNIDDPKDCEKLLERWQAGI